MTSSDTNLPPQTTDVDFFMAGCPRCGTTWVHAALKDHPEIYLPPQKQTYFFDEFYENGIDWYLENFRGKTRDHKVAGEIATGYSLPHALPRLAEHFPHAKILLAMRNPAERAYSFFQSRAVSEGWRTVMEAAAAQPNILEQGRYADHIERIYQHFPKEKVMLLFYDDLKNDDRAYLSSILNFLGVDASFQSKQLGRMVQVAAFPGLRRVIRRMRLGWALDRLSGSAVGDWIRKRLKDNSVRRYPPMDKATKEFLFDYYRPHNERLMKLCDRDLSDWTE